MSSLQNEAAGVQHTFSSWDSCMEKSYCKWPVIVAIVVGVLITLSILFCIARCLFCGAECCACCFGCCCRGSRGRGRRGGDNYGYQQHPPHPNSMPYQSYPQYHSPQPPVYGGPTAYRGLQTAKFDAPTKSPAGTKFNEDSLPAMPSWDTAQTRREQEEVELEKLDHPHAQQEHLLPKNDTAQGYNGQQQYAGALPYGAQNTNHNGQHQYAPSTSSYGAQNTSYNSPYNSSQEHSYAGDVGNTGAAPYHDYSRHQQYAPSVPMSPVSSTAYEPSVAAPPSYHTRPPSAAAVSPIQGGYTAYGGQGNQFPRRPVQGSWRDV